MNLCPYGMPVSWVDALPAMPQCWPFTLILIKLWAFEFDRYGHESLPC